MWWICIYIITVIRNLCLNTFKSLLNCHQWWFWWTEFLWGWYSELFHLAWSEVVLAANTVPPWNILYHHVLWNIEDMQRRACTQCTQHHSTTVLSCKVHCIKGYQRFCTGFGMLLVSRGIWWSCLTRLRQFVGSAGMRN